MICSAARGCSSNAHGLHAGSIRVRSRAAAPPWLAAAAPPCRRQAACMLCCERASRGRVQAQARPHLRDGVVVGPLDQHRAAVGVPHVLQAWRGGAGRQVGGWLGLKRAWGGARAPAAWRWRAGAAGARTGGGGSTGGGTGDPQAHRRKQHVQAPKRATANISETSSGRTSTNVNLSSPRTCSYTSPAWPRHSGDSSSTAGSGGKAASQPQLRRHAVPVRTRSALQAAWYNSRSPPNRAIHPPELTVKPPHASCSRSALRRLARLRAGPGGGGEGSLQRRSSACAVPPLFVPPPHSTAAGFPGC